MRENDYSLLIISKNNSFSDAIYHLVKENYSLIKICNSITDGARELLEYDYDIVIIDSPVNNDIGIDFAIDIAYKHKSGVLFLAKGDMYNEIYDKSYEYGILTIPKPTYSKILLQSLKLLEASITRERLLREKPISIKDKLEEIKIINNAKLLLINNLHLTEDEAHKYIEKRAMFIRKTKIYVAKEIIDKYKETNHE